MNILQEAEKLVSGDRNDYYGNPSVKYGLIAKLWSLILHTKITPEQVILCMIAIKLIRESIKHKRDNLVDLAGYAKLLAMVLDEDK
jgi:hypothetical protein